MAIPPAQRRLAEALTTLKKLQDDGKTAIKSVDLTRLQRESLVKNGFLRPIFKGWYMPCRPGEDTGDSTPWYAAMRDFIQGYCTERFGKKWHVSAEYSLFLHTGKTITPQQVVIHTPLGQNGLLKLPDNCSILDYKTKDFTPAAKIQLVEQIRVLSLPVALIRVPEAFFTTYAQDAHIALHQLRDVSDLNRELLEGGHSTVAGRLAGALRASGREDLADNVLATMRAAGYVVIESNPFSIAPPILAFSRVQSPYVLRMRLMWQAMRETVLVSFPTEPGIPTNIEKFMKTVEENYKTDAYHSLSIEGYRVTPELIQKVATGDWNPDSNDSDAQMKNAMAAHGYWLAHNEVKATIRSILTGVNPGEAFRRDHASWYRNLFSPNVDAGFLKPSDLAGYRTDKVFIRGATHVPPSQDAVRDMMPELCDLLEDEPNTTVRAVLGHFLFVYIHPYFDGNGRLGRFLMNAMLASGGYPWTVIRIEKRANYMAALEAASSRGKIQPFAEFIASSMQSDGI
ncbi:Fic family protein [Geopsychrobacter electrodiphilus]|uniref:Fic family protein n=1 Tax=Geopsychrobacter electrodiphilus TaxID=225196 RepID=UPI000361760A|nr:Fic family protein [Geopsychrobacter electrodiphilus]